MVTKRFLFALLFFLFAITVKAQQVTEVITDFGGFWKSGVGYLNATYPNTSHNVLSFAYNGVNYSTGVDDAKLTTNSITYTAGDFRAFPVATVGGNITSGASIYIALASHYDGIPNGYSNPLPSLKIKDVLIDGVHGLDLGTGATNIPASALINFPVSTVISSSIADAKPDILVSQIASPTSTGDTLYFVNSSGTVVGNKVSINWTSISILGTYYLDLYTLPTGALCDTAKISGTFDKETTRDIRLLAFKLSDFGITAGNAATVAGFILKASGTSDPAFIAYNSDAFVIPAPVITTQPVTQIVCPNASHSVTFSVTATGGSLTYQWKKNGVDISGATNTAYTISNVTSSSAGAYTVVVSNPVGAVVSNTAYLNVQIAVQPSPASQTIATGASCTISVTANNAMGYQWKQGGVNISGATSNTYTINPVTSTSPLDYTVQVSDTTSGGCATVLSNIVTVTGSTTLYSKASVNLNLASSWGVATNGTGSSPVDFSRAEHTFIVKNNAATGGDLTIAGTLDLANAVTAITGNTTLDAGNVIRSGTGSLAGSSTANLTVRGTSNLYFQTGNDLLKNFAVYGGTATLLSPLAITGGSAFGTVTLNGGTLATGGYLSFKSDGLGTARLGTIASGASITGNITIERYIPAGRSWRLLTAPVKSAGAPTINASWQEGLTTASSNPNLYPGYGTHITGGSTANGFDQGITTNASIKIFNNNTGLFTPLPASSGTNIAITNYPAYSLYVRGDRGTNLMQGTSAALSPTVLRIKGQPNTGDQVFNVNATGYTLIGNPFVSAIDFKTITKNNVGSSFYIWDPKLAGAWGLGGYVTISWNNGTNSFDMTSSVSSISQYVQSGEPFFVRSADGISTGTLTIKETDKTSNGSDQVFGFVANHSQKLRANLLLVNADSSSSLLDGALVTYNGNNSNEVDGDDAIKIGNSSENIAINRNANLLSIERRKTIQWDDTLSFSIYKMKLQNYRLEIIADNMDAPALAAVIKDTYSNTVNNMPIDLNGTTYIPFSVNTDPASYASDRFSIVFKQAAPLPVTFSSVKAYQHQNDIAVEWNTENEINIKEYEVERSADGRSFVKINTTIATATNGGSGSYKFIDHDHLGGNNYYRIHSVERSGSKGYSRIVKVQVIKGSPSVIVYPNPVLGNTISMQFNNIKSGDYSMQLFNASGQLISFKSITHNAAVAAENVEIKKNFPPGKYDLKLTGDNIKINIPVIKQ